MKKIIKIALLLGFTAFAKPALAHETLYYSFATHKIYLSIDLPYAYWWGSHLLEPRPYQMQMPRPGRYATWQRNREVLTKIALAKMQAYTHVTQPLPSEPLEPSVTLSNSKNLPQIQFQPPTTKH